MTRILITGANRGIGLGFATHYLAQGARVFATCRANSDRAALDALQTRYPDGLTIVELDVTDEDSIARARQQVGQHVPALDILINNAGVFFPSENLQEVTADALAQSFAVNTIAPLLVAQHFGDLLQAGQSPRLVNLTAPTPPISKYPRTVNHAYMASRYALNALTRMIALEWESKGIITVALWPGYIRTDMNRDPAAAPVETAIPVAAQVIDSLTAGHNGCCLLPDGTRYDW